MYVFVCTSNSIHKNFILTSCTDYNNYNTNRVIHICISLLFIYCTWVTALF